MGPTSNDGVDKQATRQRARARGQLTLRVDGPTRAGPLGAGSPANECRNAGATRTLLGQGRGPQPCLPAPEASRGDVEQAASQGNRRGTANIPFKSLFALTGVGVAGSWQSCVPDGEFPAETDVRPRVRPRATEVRGPESRRFGTVVAGL